MDELRDLERAMWSVTTRSDHDWMDRHLTPDFQEFGRSGRRYDRTAAIDVAVPRFTATLDSIDVDEVADGVALLTYRSAFTGPDGVPEFANRASIWVRGDAGWRMRFHQGTPCADWRT